MKDLAASGQTGTIRIDRNPDHLAIDRYEGKVGKLAIPTVYHGRGERRYGRRHERDAVHLPGRR